MFRAEFFAVNAFLQPSPVEATTLGALQKKVKPVLRDGYCDGHAILYDDKRAIGIMRKACSKTISARSSGESVSYKKF